MSPGSNTVSYPVFAHIGLRENPGKNLNQVTCPDRESNLGHLISRLDVLTVTPQKKQRQILTEKIRDAPPSAKDMSRLKYSYTRGQVWERLDGLAMRSVLWHSDH
ncbi:hypothetical protein ANN_00361 [Periplaneta americana]|uniref:Uncharacterized protein n=1 Tax=Periplaneta americana TaxID=6978 RepID=A0ABQ8TTS7_PERAM|nr:hypothetical protein ANN_00361 [Periplaneta americana]